MGNLAATIPFRQLPETYSVIEFGVGSQFAPSPTVLQDVRWEQNPHWRFDGGRSYTACDNGTVGPGHDYLGTPEEIQRRARHGLDQFATRIASRRPEENIRFVFCDAQDLAVPPGNEVLISNVLSSDIDSEAIGSLLARAKALLVAGGLLVVRETFTPRLHPPDKLTERLGALGFEQTEVVTPGDTSFDALTAYYGPTVHDVEIPSAGIRPKADRYFCLTIRP